MLIFECRCESGCPEVFCKEVLLKYFPKFTGKYHCQASGLQLY